MSFNIKTIFRSFIYFLNHNSLILTMFQYICSLRVNECNNLYKSFSPMQGIDGQKSRYRRGCDDHQLCQVTFIISQYLLHLLGKGSVIFS